MVNSQIWQLRGNEHKNITVFLDAFLEERNQNEDVGGNFTGVLQKEMGMDTGIEDHMKMAKEGGHALQRFQQKPTLNVRHLVFRI